MAKGQSLVPFFQALKAGEKVYLPSGAGIINPGHRSD
jgi:hypothetical protein